MEQGLIQASKPLLSQARGFTPLCPPGAVPRVPGGLWWSTVAPSLLCCQAGLGASAGSCPSPAAKPDLPGMHEKEGLAVQEKGCAGEGRAVQEKEGLFFPSSAWDAGGICRDELTPLLQSRS